MIQRVRELAHTAAVTRILTFLRTAVAVLRTVGAELGSLWRRSLQIRVVVSTVALSSTVVLVLGLVLQTQIAGRLLETKTTAALQQMENSRGVVERELATVDPAGAALDSRLAAALDRLVNPGSGTTGTITGAGPFEPVLVDGAVVGQAGADVPDSAKVAEGPFDDVPAALRDAVELGALAHKITTVQREGVPVPMLVVGVPVASANRSLQLYLLFPLDQEQSTLSLVQSTLVVGGLVLLVLIAGITSLVVRQVVTPVRQAAEVAERFADGHLEERIPVFGQDDMARLGTSFNEMASGIAGQIRQLEEFGALQRSFTSDVSHELRTPLTTVRMAADLIYDSREDMDPGLRRSSELLVHELDRFESLLGDLLEISRLDAGVADLVSDTVDVRDTVRSTVDAVDSVVQSSGCELRLLLPADPVLAEIDPRRVGRILRNLLLNALDHGEGRPVLVYVGADPDAVAVLVRDHGVGLRPGEADLVFTRFWRGDPSRDRRTGGTGLGLSISLEDARLHGGSLEAWGEPGRGAAFRLTLPRRPDAAVTGSPLDWEPAVVPAPVEPNPTPSEVIT